MIYVAGAGTKVRQLVDSLRAVGTSATCAEYVSRGVPEAEQPNVELNAILASTRMLLVPGTWESDPEALLDVLIADGAGVPIAIAAAALAA